MVPPYPVIGGGGAPPGSAAYDSDESHRSSWSWTRSGPLDRLGKGKVFTYSLPSVGPGADPGVQAVSLKSRKVNHAIDWQ